MDLPQTAQQLLEIEHRQEEVLRSLEELNAQVERAVARYQSDLRVFLPVGDSQ